MTFIRLSLSMIFHPSDTFRTIRRYRNLSVYPAVLLILASMVAVRCASIYLVHFPLATLDVKDANLLLESAKLLVPLLSWVGALYAVTTILQGESHPREVLLSSCYCMMPYVFLQLPLALLSNAMSLEEILLYRALEGAMIVWIGALVFRSVMVLNNYEPAQTVFICGVSLFAVLVLWAVLTLVFSLSSQFVVFVVGIIREIRMNLNR